MGVAELPGIGKSKFNKQNMYDTPTTYMEPK